MPICPRQREFLGNCVRIFQGGAGMSLSQEQKTQAWQMWHPARSSAKVPAAVKALWCIHPNFMAPATWCRKEAHILPMVQKSPQNLLKVHISPN